MFLKSLSFNLDRMQEHKKNLKNTLPQGAETRYDRFQQTGRAASENGQPYNFHPHVLEMKDPVVENI